MLSDELLLLNWNLNHSNKNVSPRQDFDVYPQYRSIKHKQSVIGPAQICIIRLECNLYHIFPSCDLPSCPVQVAVRISYHKIRRQDEILACFFFLLYDDKLRYKSQLLFLLFWAHSLHVVLLNIF